MRTIGIDLGGTKLEIAVVSENGQIEERVRLKTDVLGGYEAVLNQISTAIQTFKKTALGVGVGIPGQVDPSKGVIHFAPNLFWKDLPFQKDLEGKIQMPVKIINDVKAATLGEWCFGAGTGCSDLLCLFVGTGIGGGIIANNQLLVGATYCAGELGHTRVGSHQRVCRCGGVGCLEAIAGGLAIAERAKEAIKNDPSSASTILRFAEEGEITARSVALAHKEGDYLAHELMVVTENALVEGCINFVHSFNPSRLILGGGIITGFPFLISAIERGIKAKGLKAATDKLQVVPSALGNDAGVVGAASLFN